MVEKHRKNFHKTHNLKADDVENLSPNTEKLRKYVLFAVENSVDMCGNKKRLVENRVDSV